MGAEHNFRGAIIPGNNILSEVLTLLLGQVPAKAEVAYFQIAVFVEEDVRRLQVSVDDFCGVKILERT